MCSEKSTRSELAWGHTSGLIFSTKWPAAPPTGIPQLWRERGSFCLLVMGMEEGRSWAILLTDGIISGDSLLTSLRYTVNMTLDKMVKMFRFNLDLQIHDDFTSMH